MYTCACIAAIKAILMLLYPDCRLGIQEKVVGGLGLMLLRSGDVRLD